MALRDQPYLPLYVQDFMTDEKLMECSAEATGVYIRIMCLMHKSEQYGTVLLKQKDKQTDNQVENFAAKLSKFLPFSLQEITSGLTELLDEGVVSISGNKLIQKRMIKDGELSVKRSLSGKKGGNPILKKDEISLTKTSSKNPKTSNPKTQANTEYEIEYENDNINEEIRGGAGGETEPRATSPSSLETSPQVEPEQVPKNLIHVSELQKKYLAKGFPKQEAIMRAFPTLCKTHQGVLEWLEKFTNLQAAGSEEEQYRTWPDYESHFKNWLAKQQPNEQQSISNQRAQNGYANPRQQTNTTTRFAGRLTDKLQQAERSRVEGLAAIGEIDLDTTNAS